MGDPTSPDDPLTVTDAASRHLLCCDALEATREELAYLDTHRRNNLLPMCPEQTISDKKSGLYFVVRVKIPGRQFRVERKWVNLPPGMAVEAEIHTGTRSVAEYFLSPLITTAGEAMRERCTQGDKCQIVNVSRELIKVFPRDSSHFPGFTPPRGSV